MLPFHPLSPAQRESFARDGFLIVRRALEPETVAALREAVDRLAAPFLTKPVVLDRPEYNHLDHRPGLLYEPAFLDLVAQPKVVSLLVQLLGPNIHLHSTSLTCKRPERVSGGPFRRGWHRDMRLPKDLGNVGLSRVGIKVCYCLTDFHRPDSGMTLMVRGSHLRQEPLVVPPGAVDPIGVEVCDHHVDAGDAVFFENRIFHTAAPNLSDRTSKVLIYGYAYRWMKQEIYLDSPDEQLLACSDPIRRQLLGWYRDIDTPPWALQEWARRHGVLPAPVAWTVEPPSEETP